MIQWYPGHMKKAKDEISNGIRKIDVVIEILDARLPVSSSNHILDELRANKPCIKILNKSDLADPEVTKLWVAEIEKTDNMKAMPLVAHDKAVVQTLPQMCHMLTKGQLKRAVRAMVVGIPNVGKSTLINTLAGRKLAKTGNQPAITRHQQKVQIKSGRDGMDISDTPGILWPNLEDRDGAYRLAASGAIRETAMDYQDVAMTIAGYLIENYTDLLVSRYKLKEAPDKAIALIEEIGRRRGCLKKGGIVNTHKASEVFINELRGGKIGRISLEKPQTSLQNE